eukprot:IDg773t1
MGFSRSYYISEMVEDIPSITHLGVVPGSPLKMVKREREKGNPRKRASACELFATNPNLYRSLKDFVRARH